MEPPNLEPPSLESPSLESPSLEPIDAVIVGAGFAGLYMLYRLRGLGLSARVFEAGDGVGGTWYWNRYPGARCDVESMQYSYAFDPDLQQDWRWTERFAAQAEILRYAEHVTDRFDLRRDIRFATRVEEAGFDGEHWIVRTDRGDAVAARFLILAVGCLSSARVPDIAGRDDFRGASYHTGAWPHAGVDFTGQRVAVIGTGSSAVQSIPVIAAAAAHLTVFQRTANFIIPARNRPLEPEHEAWWKSQYPTLRQEARMTKSGIRYRFNDRSALDADPAERAAEYRARWETGGLGFLAAFNDLGIDRTANDTAAAFVRDRIRETVRDPATADALSPQGHAIGTKRLCVDSFYYETFNRTNVTLVDLRRTPITAVTATGIRTDAAEYPVDAIVYATGFDAMTGSIARIAITGTDGIALADKWAAGPRAYLGVMTAGFPNLFMITGPGSPSVLSNMLVSIEQHVEWIADCLGHMQARGLDRIDATLAAEDDWVAHTNEVAARTLHPTANSWYMGANIPGKPRVFMPYIGGVGVYRQICEEIVAEGYRGFVLERVRVPA